MKKIIFLLLTLTSLIACKKKEPVPPTPPVIPDPQACFTPIDTTVKIDEVITFKNCSKDANSYEWDFGDATTAAVSNPTKKYSAEGTYTVKMIAYNAAKDKKSEKTATVKVVTNEVEPFAYFEVDHSVSTPGVSLKFTNLSEDAYSYLWEFGDGSSSTLQHPSKIYPATGTFTVKLIVYSPSKKLQDEHSITVTIGKLYVSSIRINSIQFVDATGAAWDPFGGSPDPFAAMAPQGASQYTFATSYFPDVVPADMPLTFDNLNWEIAENKDWHFDLYDDDGADVPDQMANGLFNPYQFMYTGSKNLKGGGFDMDVFLEIK